MDVWRMAWLQRARRREDENRRMARETRSEKPGPRGEEEERAPLQWGRSGVASGLSGCVVEAFPTRTLE